MLTYWKFKQIYKYTPYRQYVWESFKSWFRGIINIPRATYLCIKYPFLYPRNRFNGLHYNNWKIQNFLIELMERTNWWAKPLHTIMKFYHDNILQIFHCLPTYTEWDCMEPGWKKAFGKQYLKDLKEAAIKDRYLKFLRITQLKEKFGICNLYLNYYGDNVLKVIQKYEKLSWETCIKCGKPATHTSRGWICPYCEECVNKSEHPEGFVKRGTEEEKTLILY